MTTLKEQRKTLIDQGWAITDRARAETRDLTPDEAGRVEDIVAKARQIDRQIDAAAKGDAFWNEVGSASAGGDFYGDGERGPGVKRLDFRNLSAKIAHSMRAYSATASPGVKGLVPAGSTVLDTPVVNAVPFPGSAGQETAPRLVESLPLVTRPSATYSFLRQTVVATPGGAGVVAAGAVKPTMKLGVERVDAELSVVAVLSEPLDKYLLEDAESLATWVRAELADAVVTELERQVLVGTGVGTDLVGLSATSGILVQPFAVDPLVTLQHGISELESLGVAPALIVLPPSAWLTIQTTRNSGGGFDVGGPVDATARTAWGTPVVLAAGLAADVGYVVGNDSVAISTDGRGLRVDWGTPGDAFTRNEVVARVEGRFGLDVMRPHAVVRMDLTAA